MGIFALMFYLVYLYIRDQRHHPSQSLSLLKLELSESKASEQRLREELNILKNSIQQTFVDPVTNLLGWPIFKDRLMQNIKENVRNQLSFSIVYIDIDNFKMINNAFGYEMGDLILKAVAERLQACIRQVDSATRYAKDTFVLLLAQLTKAEMTVFIIQRILQALAPPFQIKEHEIYLTVSMGISVYPMDGEDTEILLRNAEQALLLAKEKQGNDYQFYQTTHQLGSQRELILYAHLNQESLFQELKVYYQPIKNVVTDNIFGMEILLHWQHPEFGLIKQEELFEHAIKQRRLNVISEWLLRRSIQQFIHWRSFGFFPDCLAFSITINQLENSHFIYSLSQILQELQCKPEWLLLKIVGSLSSGGHLNDPNSMITSTFTAVSSDVLEKSFNMLKYLRIKMAVAEFDSSALSLRQLRVFPVHYLMLSQLFIEDMPTHPQTVELIKAVISFATALSMQIIVQGVGSEQQLLTLKSLGCALMQGKLLGDPLPENEVITKMTVATV